MLGTTGKYRLDTRLGGGGMAEVFVGASVGAEGFSRKVAIKRVLPGFSDNPAFSQMFVAEAQISSRLVHPNIVSVLDFDRDPENRLFLVMELVEGKDLDTLNASGVVPYPLVIYLISEVLRGLGHAHDLPVGTDLRGIVHRDVSPHNVLLSWEGAVKVSDFGIAKARAASEATASVFIKGKPAYMSPEQANGQPLDGRSDLFAVGVMLWEMLVGRRLFVAEDTRATLAAVLFGQIARPRSLRGDVPKDLERVVMKLLERDLPARYATAEAAIADLLACADAPKDGRALLMHTLAERFPQDAPVRHSMVGRRSGGATPLPPNAATIGAGSNLMTPPPALPSLGEARAAPTSTIDYGRPKKPRRLALALIALGVLVAAGAATFAIVSAVGGKGKPALDAFHEAPVPPPPQPAAAVPVDAQAQPVAIDAAPVPIDAAPPDAPEKQAASHAPAVEKKGRLVVSAMPVLTVYVDKKRIHDTPVDIPLTVGRHQVRMVNADVNHDETITVTITDGKTTTVDRE